MQTLTITVICEVSANGIITPLSIRWEDGRTWKITRVLHTCSAAAYEYAGIRYTVLIGSKEKYIYRTGYRWYVEIPSPKEVLEHGKPHS